MRIGIDISQISHEGTGVARFTDGLVTAILDYDKTHQWSFFFSSLRKNLNADLEKRIIDKGHAIIKQRIPPTLLSFINNAIHHQALSSIVYRLSSSLDWFITSDWTEPPMDCKKATIIHDLAYLRFPETVDKTIKKNQKERVQWIKKESSVIIADSQSTKEDVHNLLDIDTKKITTIYPGVTIQKPDQQQIRKTIRKYNLKKPFLLTVGKIEPRKNLERLVDAFQNMNDETIDLVIVGPKGWYEPQISSSIKYLGYVEDQDLYSLYASCLFFVYPSLWEGFGYPIVEAMKLGVPVVTSNTSSPKEIAREAALLFDPLNTNDILHCLNTMKQNRKIREVLGQKGEKRSELFTWKNYYNTMVRVLS